MCNKVFSLINRNLFNEKEFTSLSKKNFGLTRKKFKSPRISPKNTLNNQEISRNVVFIFFLMKFSVHYFYFCIPCSFQKIK